MKKLTWSGTGSIPMIGDEVTVSMNSLGPGKVMGLFEADGYIGVAVQLSSPPDWFVKQNDGNVRAHVYGAELKFEAGVS